MLVQLPGGSSDQPRPRAARNLSAFEAGLRRDLASGPLVSYDPVLGGVGKRCIDLSIALLALPLWLPVLVASAAWAKLRHGGRVFYAHVRIGYGGRPFEYFSLRVPPATAQVGPEERQTDAWASVEERAEGRGAKWFWVLERLPQMFNVILGDMALVGPRPLSRDELEPLKSARRYYLSARPGVVGVRAVADDDQEQAAQYKAYAMAWALSTDALILWDAWCELRVRGELWRPGLRLASWWASAPKALVRRRERADETPQDTL